MVTAGQRVERDFTAVNLITDRIIGAAIAVHRELGPGLLESPYRKCLAVEMDHVGLKVERERWLPLRYRHLEIENAYRLDLIVEDQVVVEVKSVKRFDPVFDAQMLTYLKLTRCHVGLIINFNKKIVTNGVRRLVL